MRQSRRVSPNQTVTFTESIPNRLGVLDDISNANISVKVESPSGARATFAAVGMSTGAVTYTGTLKNEIGAHQVTIWVDGDIRGIFDLVAGGLPAEAGTPHITVTADRTTWTADLA